MAYTGTHSEALEAKITAQRFEFKYAVTEVQAMAIRDYIDAHVEKDLHLDAERDYPILSLYYDDPQMYTFWSSEKGEKNRYKLRARTYTTQADAPIFLEVKRRTNWVLRKHRVRLGSRQARQFLGNNRSTADVVAIGSPKERQDFYTFRDLVDARQATPRVMVRYRREACVSAHGEPVRLTFDRELRCQTCFLYEDTVWDARGPWYEPPNFQVALEIKFTDVYPGWVEQLVRRFNLTPQSISKYGLCVKELNRQGIRVGCVH